VHEYTVEWTGTYETNTPVEAAQEAWAAMQRQGSIANVFEVSDEHDMTVNVDLDDIKDSIAVWVPGNLAMAELAEWMAAEQWPVDEIVEMIRSPHKYANEYSKMIMDKAFDVVAQEPEEIDDGAEDGTDETTKES
jgi:hypothetical protein